MERFSRFLNALFILALMGVLAAAYYQQYFKHQRPCPLCILQRISMIGVSMGLFLNLRNKISSSNYGYSIIFAIFGSGVSLRQIALHVCFNFPVFGIPVFGLELFTWAFLVFAASIFSIGVLLFLIPEKQSVKKMNWFEGISGAILLVLLASNCFTTFLECSFGLCIDLPYPQPPST